jgi:hypothetical protein
MGKNSTFIRSDPELDPDPEPDPDQRYGGSGSAQKYHESLNTAFGKAIFKYTELQHPASSAFLKHSTE